MATLLRKDKARLEKYLQMDSGYVLDFSNRTFANFFEGFNIDIEEEQYQYGSGSKANRMRGFWDISDDVTVGTVLLGLIEYYDEQREGSYHGERNHSETMRANCIDIATQLASGRYSENSTTIRQPKFRPNQTKPTAQNLHGIFNTSPQNSLQTPVGQPTQQPPQKLATQGWG
ncbi:hypothetical protein AB4405_24065, partial [Vibrio sp. 10N.261.51.F12]